MKRLVTAFILCLLSVPACSGSGGTDPMMYLGTWRLQNQDGAYTVMSLRNNGSLEIDIRREGQLSKIVEKSEKATGSWDADETGARLTLTVTAGAAAIGWAEGAATYTLRHLDGALMILASPDNREYRWEKSSHRASDTPAEGAGPSLTLAPLVVNLTPGSTQTGRRYQWLCLAMEVQLSPGSPAPAARSQWQDKVILLLSSKTYEEVNTLDKLKRIGNELKTLLDPYMDGAIENVVFTRTIVTGNQEAVDTFCSQFES